MILDYYIKIYKRVKSRNDYNEQVESLELYIGLPATVNYRGGREGTYARQVVATGDVSFGTRFYPGIDETMVIEFAGKMYEINNIEPVGRRSWLIMHSRTSDNVQVPQLTVDSDTDTDTTVHPDTDTDTDQT